MNRFSVIIPFYNREKFLLRTLRSVAAQQIRPLQIVLVDNASTDNSVEVCRNFIAENAATDGLTITLAAEPAQGAAKARNRGISAATGEWLSFFDSDDEMSPDFLSDAEAAIRDNDCELIAAATQMVFEDGRKKRRKVYHTSRVTDQLLTGMLATQGMIFKKTFLEIIGGWDGSLGIWDDWELGIRSLSARPRMVWLKEKAYHSIYQHAESITGTDFSSRFDGLILVFAAAKRDIEAAGQDCRTARFTLNARAALLAGHLMREHKKEQAALFLNRYTKTEALPLRFILLKLFSKVLMG